MPLATHLTQQTIDKLKRLRDDHYEKPMSMSTWREYHDKITYFADVLLAAAEERFAANAAPLDWNPPQQ